LTFILDIKSLEKKTNKTDGQIFSILFDFEKFGKFKRSFTKQLVLCIHSNSFESFERCVIRLDQFYLFNQHVSKLYKLIGTKQIFIEYGKEICSHYNSNFRPFNVFVYENVIKTIVKRDSNAVH
jgi:hypothetical protein